MVGDMVNNDPRHFLLKYEGRIPILYCTWWPYIRDLNILWIGWHHICMKHSWQESWIPQNTRIDNSSYCPCLHTIYKCDSAASFSTSSFERRSGKVFSRDCIGIYREHLLHEYVYNIGRLRPERPIIYLWIGASFYLQLLDVPTSIRPIICGSDARARKQRRWAVSIRRSNGACSAWVIRGSAKWAIARTVSNKAFNLSKLNILSNVCLDASHAFRCYIENCK